MKSLKKFDCHLCGASQYPLFSVYKYKHKSNNKSSKIFKVVWASLVMQQNGGRERRRDTANGGGKSGVRRRGGIGGKAAEYTAGRGSIRQRKGRTYGNGEAGHITEELLISQTLCYTTRQEVLDYNCFIVQGEL